MASDDVTVAEEPNVGEEASCARIGGVSGLRANPLKHLAYLLREKLRAAQGGPCNLVQVQRTWIASIASLLLN